ncbi:hypothetical protein FLO80_07310 [Aquicoccus porphyridii]|uniref:Uncharacterized protein n=1 Tax=Aquicoccus porphyridii TaxID=1852029 RepID=A0A5A9ZHX1_9RHOB|nr:hypothetical protein [Aquicoccus porphyridii]KAA0916625.1 hypothetical protein FLO80_07310 [Aquicoccus porphyridii]
MDDFKLTLEGDGITVKRSVDRETALAILNSVLASKKSETTGELATVQEFAERSDESEAPVSDRSTKASEYSKPLSLREYVYQYEPKTNAQMILCIAQYLAEHEGADRFKRDEIRPRFPSAGEALPKNYTRDFQTAMDKGWIGADPTNKELFFVTRTGEQQLQKGFRGRRN